MSTTMIPRRDAGTDYSTGQPASIYFWYRQSPRPFEVDDSNITEYEPARDFPGMTTVTLDTLGRLRSFDAVPPEKEFIPYS